MEDIEKEIKKKRKKQVIIESAMKESKKDIKTIKETR